MYGNYQVCIGMCDVAVMRTYQFRILDFFYVLCIYLTVGGKIFNDVAMLIDYSDETISRIIFFSVFAANIRVHYELNLNPKFKKNAPESWDVYMFAVTII